MFFVKRALALWLGLFFYFCIYSQEQENSIPVSGEVSAAIGTLLVEDGGASFYWQNGLTLDFGQNFFGGIELGHVYSNMSWLNVSIFGFMGQFGIDTPRGGFNLTSGFFAHPAANASAGNFSLSFYGGNGFFLSLDTPLRYAPLSITPHFFYGNAGWDDGDMYWFFGKPKIPFLFAYGIDIGFDQQDYHKHSLGFRNVITDVKIVSNKNESLFDAALDAFLLMYQFSLERADISFSGTVGWLYAGASLDGALTSSNQPYFLFPFQFFDISASYNAHAGLALFRFRDSRRIIRYSLDLGAMHILYDQGKADTHFRMKNLFGGKEDFGSEDLDISGLGAAFLLLEAGLHPLSVGKNKQGQLSLSLQKAFVIPWGYNKLFSPGGGTSLPETSPSSWDPGSLIKTILLSGISIKGFLTF